MNRPDHNLRLSRGSGIIRPPGGESVCVIGVGGIGSNAVHMLASMGITDFEVVDPDLVGEENIFPGFFRMADDGARKVDVMWHYATDMGGITVNPFFGEFIDWDQPRRFTFGIISTDNTETRREIYPHLREKCQVVLDGRMGGKLCSVFTVCSDDDVAGEVYESYLEGENAELPCGQKATAPLTKGMIPFMIGMAVGRHLNGEEPVFLQRYDMATGMLLNIPAKD